MYLTPFHVMLVMKDENILNKPSLQASFRHLSDAEEYKDRMNKQYDMFHFFIKEVK